jgi:hypothetical protein
MSRSSQKLREFMHNPVENIRELHREYGLDQKEFSKILVITCTALLFISIHATNTLTSVQNDLQETDSQVQQASAVITSEDFQNAMDQLERIQGRGLINQVETARSSFRSAQDSFDDISQAEQRVGESVRMYQWMSLISILGIVSGVALRFM